MIYVNSYGGSGSKYLVKQIAKSFNSFSYSEMHCHIKKPNEFNFSANDKVVFIYADPVDAIKSFFLRQSLNTKQHGFNNQGGKGSQDWPYVHCRNIQGRYQEMDTNWQLKDFIDNGEDLFCLEEFFDSWIDHDLEIPVIFIKYETLWDSKSKLMCMLGKNEYVNFEEFKPRTKFEFSLSKDREAKLNRMYSHLKERIEKLNYVFVI